MVRSDSIALADLRRGLKDAGYEEENLTVEKIEECIGLARRLEQGEKVMLYGEQVTRRTLAPDVRRSSDMLESCRSGRRVVPAGVRVPLLPHPRLQLHGQGEQHDRARCDGQCVASGIMEVHERMSCAGSCTTVSDFWRPWCGHALGSRGDVDDRWVVVPIAALPGGDAGVDVGAGTVDLTSFPFARRRGQVVSYYSPLIPVPWSLVPSRGGFLCSESMADDHVRR